MRRIATALRAVEFAESHAAAPFRRPQRTEAIKTSASVAATPPNQQDDGTRRVVDLFACRERPRSR